MKKMLVIVFFLTPLAHASDSSHSGEEQPLLHRCKHPVTVALLKKHIVNNEFNFTEHRLCLKDSCAKEFSIFVQSNRNIKMGNIKISENKIELLKTLISKEVNILSSEDAKKVKAQAKPKDHQD